MSAYQSRTPAMPYGHDQNLRLGQNPHKSVSVILSMNTVKESAASSAALSHCRRLELGVALAVFVAGYMSPLRVKTCAA